MEKVCEILSLIIKQHLMRTGGANPEKWETVTSFDDLFIKTRRVSKNFTRIEIKDISK